MDEPKQGRADCGGIKENVKLLTPKIFTPDAPSSSPAPMLRKRIFIPIALSITLFCLSFATRRVPPTRHFLAVQESDVPSYLIDQNDGPGIRIENEYPRMSSLSLYQWDYIVEPYRITTLTVTSPRARCWYFWTIRLENRTQYETVVYMDEPLNFTFTLPNEEFEISVVELVNRTLSNDKPHHGLWRSIVHAMCKYVRREIRELTSKDRMDYFGALELVYRLSMDEGLQRFGADFANYEYFVYKHLDQYTLKGCTPYHGGLAFITSHAAFTLELEQALQAINPRITQPYWDSVRDSSELHTNWGTSTLFSNDYFGPRDSGEESHEISGRWFSSLPIPSNFSAPNHNSYGRVTAPVNNDPSEFVTRSSSVCGLPSQVPLPGCTEMLGCINTSSLTSLESCMENEMHSYLHMALGGAWECPYSFKDFTAEHPKFSKSLGFVGLNIMNALWNNMLSAGYLKCPLSCQKNVAYSDCSCSCPSIDNTNLTDDEVYNILDHSKIFSTLSRGLQGDKFLGERATPDGKMEYHWLSFEDSESIELNRFLLSSACHPGKMGQMATGGSTNDPLFWVLHPIYDRLWMFIRLSPAHEEFDHFWDDDLARCDGHRYHDLLPFSHLFGEEKSDMHFYSNQELYENLDPKNPRVPYVYDTFEWSSCA